MTEFLRKAQTFLEIAQALREIAGSESYLINGISYTYLPTRTSR
jgi:hypothetical protein